MHSILDLVDNRVDLITCFVVLHHVPNLQPMLKQLVRILRPNGYLIMREHDCKRDRSLQCKYLNFIHAFMRIARIGEFAHSSADHTGAAQGASNDNALNPAAFWNEQKADIIEETSAIHYRTRAEWQKELACVGFRPIASLTYDGNEASNPQALFYEVYQLNRK